LPLNRIFKLNRLYFLILLVSDFVIIALSILFAVMIRFGSVYSSSVPLTAMVGTWIFLAISEILAMMVENLYVIRTTVNNVMNVFRTIRVIVAVSILFIVVLFLSHFPTSVFICSRLAVLIIMILWLFMTLTSRLLIIPGIYTRLLRIFGLKKMTVVLFGPREICRKIRSTLLKSSVYRKLLDLKIHTEVLPEDPASRFARCIEVLEDHDANELTMVFEEGNFDDMAHFVLLTRRAGIPFSIYSRRIPELGYFDPWMSIGEYGALTFFSRQWTRVSDFLWRLSDILIAITGLLVFLPILAVAVPAIFLTSSGGVLFKQTRMGRGRKPFNFLKFRSMHVNASDRKSVHKEYFQRYVNGDSADESKKGEVFKTISSKAVTPVGRIIRRTSVDELPQILNVLRGEMSIVGPRPCIDYELEHYTSEWLQQRFSIKPGLTGIWQVYGRSRLGFKKSQFLDFVYVMSRTDGINIRLILKTFPVMFFSKGGL